MYYAVIITTIKIGGYKMERSMANLYSLKGFLHEFGFYSNSNTILDDSSFLLKNGSIHFEEYHKAFLKLINSLFDLKDKIVLEVGGSNLPREIIIDTFKVKKWVCIDKPWWNTEKNKEHLSKVKMVDFKTPLDEIMGLEDYIIFNEYIDDVP